MKTNADVLLAKGVTIGDFMMALHTYTPFREYEKNDTNVAYLVESFLEKNALPNMTEAERTILENIGDNFDIILRTETGYLKLRSSETDTNIMLSQFKDHLFKFIKNGEQYKIKELLEDD